MTWLLLVLAVLLLGGGVLAAVGPFDAPGRLAPAEDERRDVLPPPDRPLTADDLDAVRFSTVVRGYAADEVDALLARLSGEWRERA